METYGLPAKGDDVGDLPSFSDTMSGTVVVLDIGKTNIKLVAFDAMDGAEVWSRSCPNATRLDGAYPHADVEAIEKFLLDGLADVGRSRNGFVDGIAVTTHSNSGALLAGEALALPVLDYEFDGINETAEAYAKLRPPFYETMSPRLPEGQNLGAQLFWQQCRFPEQFNTASTFVTYPQYWAFKLCGTVATEFTSLGCHTDLWMPAHRRFSGLVARAGWSHLMAPIRKADDVLGLMYPDLARYLGLKVPPSIFCGIHDSNASLLPYLSSQLPKSIVSSGTWAILFSIGGSLVNLDEELGTFANVNVFGLPIPSSRFMGGREFDVLTNGTMITASPDEILAVMDRRLMVFPSFAPGSGPFPSMLGSWNVLPETLTPREKCVAASLYLALMSNVCLGLLDASGETVIDGPFSKNALFCDALATLTGRSLYTTCEATAAGASRLMLPNLPVPLGTPWQGLPDAMHSALFAYAVEWYSQVNIGRSHSILTKILEEMCSLYRHRERGKIPSLSLNNTGESE
ncbi:MAG: carbohydrate kinase [Alphaproteobacteria bacterium]|nr:carbohydrate kinase [Alphaproteobacteria bacterium]